jgi:hypothetical protein
MVSELARVFAGLRTAVKARFPNEEVVSYTVVSGFLFLRLFVAATMTPVLFCLWHGAADPPPPLAAHPPRTAVHLRVRLCTWCS